MRLLLTAFVFFGGLTFTHAQTPAPSERTAEIEGRERDLPEQTRMPLQFPVSFDVSDFDRKPWTRDFEWVIVINKAAEGADQQSLRIYHNQKLMTAEDIITETEAIYGADFMKRHRADLKKRLWAPDVFKISSGREEFERQGEHGSSRDSYTITPSGYFLPQYITYRHRSEAYSNKNCGSGHVLKRVVRGRYPNQWVEKVYRRQPKCIYMDDVVFFNDSIALHRVAAGAESRLGQRASGGCVRLPAAVAMYLYVVIKHGSGSPMPKVNQNGTAMADEKGDVLRVDSNTTIWGKLNARSALIVVQEKIVPLPVKPKPPRRPVGL